MALNDFLKEYKFCFEHYMIGDTNYIAITKVIRNGELIDRVKCSIDLYDTNEWNGDSINKWDLNKLEEQTRRYQLDYFAKQIPIVDFFPLIVETDISIVYEEANINA